MSVYVDSPRLRYRRILIPALAYLLAAGSHAFIDHAYVAVILFSIALGVYWTACIAQLHGRRAAWGAAFLLAPGTLTTIDRMVLDGPLTACAAGLIFYHGTKRQRAVWVLLAAAPLIRETGVLLIAGFALYEVFRHRYSRAFALAAASLPAIVWFCVVQAKTPPSAAHAVFTRPVAGILLRIVAPTSYPFPAPIEQTLQTLDVIAVLGHLLGLGLAIWWFAFRERGPLEWAALLFAALGLMLGHPAHMRDAVGFSRPVSPLLLILFSRYLRDGLRVAAIPMLAIAAQILTYFVWQGLGIMGLQPRATAQASPSRTYAMSTAPRAPVRLRKAVAGVRNHPPTG
jgi:hypothetical protein